METAEQVQLINRGAAPVPRLLLVPPYGMCGLSRADTKTGAEQSRQDLYMFNKKVGTLTVYHLLAENIISEARLNDIIGPMAHCVGPAYMMNGFMCGK